MTAKIPQRLSWAVEKLALKPDDQVLEIGCGHGIAVAQICEKLARGKITAVDRSEKMIAVAKKRNADCVASGKAAFHIAALNKVDLDGEQFNKIFAVNVNVFWQQPARELSAIKRLLMPAGTLYLFYEPPARSRAHEAAQKVTANLEAQGFSIQEVLFEELAPMYGVCIIATL